MKTKPPTTFTLHSSATITRQDRPACSEHSTSLPPVIVLPNFASRSPLVPLQHEAVQQTPLPPTTVVCPNKPAYSQPHSFPDQYGLYEFANLSASSHG
ncbi:hypothetical protein V6N11_056556 [Hibiscus sabdariffa]|uniref:Uncharacterized protein n=2 Tax=Hibiscus sabdariffa TaxID=183260 RepID=A0ABR2T4S2_9ROSI